MVTEKVTFFLFNLPFVHKNNSLFMQNSEVMIRGHGAFRDFKLTQKNTKKGRRGGREEKTRGGVGG